MNSKQGLIVTHEVTDKNFDRGQLSGMARQATHVLTRTLKRVSTKMSLHILPYNGNA